MKTIRTEIIISASREQVWQVLTDFAAYPEWNPFIHTKGAAVEGSYLENTMYLEGRSPQHFRPRVLVANPGRELRWLGKFLISGLFDGEHYFQLEAIDDHTTRLVHGENFKGLLVGLLLKMIGTETQQAFERMNHALKARLEDLK